MSKDISRREFLKIAGMTGAAISVAGGLGGLLSACGEEKTTTTSSVGPATSVGADTTTSGTTSASIEPIKLKFHSYTTPPPSASGKASQWFMDEVTKRTNGAVSWETYWSSTLSDTAGQLDLAAKGAVDISKTCLLYFPAKFPIGHFEYAFPFPPSDPVIVTKAKRQIHEEFPEKRAEYDKNGVVFLANTVCAYYEIQSKSPVNSLADMKGKKVGMIGKYFGRWFEPVGAVSVVHGAPDRYQELQGGVLDQSLLWLDLAYSLKLHEQAPYLIEIGLGSFCAEDILFGADKFATLDPQLQNILIEVGKESELWAAEYQKGRKEEIYQLLREAQGTVSVFPEEDRLQWASMVPDIPAEWAAEVEALGLPGWEIAKRWQEITTDLGYTWTQQWAVQA